MAQGKLFTAQSPRLMAGPDGQLLQEAKLEFVKHGTEERVSVYSDECLSVLTTNPMPVDCDGVYGMAYVDSAIVFDVRVLSACGKPLYTIYKAKGIEFAPPVLFSVGAVRAYQGCAPYLILAEEGKCPVTYFRVTADPKPEESLPAVITTDTSTWKSCAVTAESLCGGMATGNYDASKDALVFARTLDTGGCELMKGNAAVVALPTAYVYVSYDADGTATLSVGGTSSCTTGGLTSYTWKIKNATGAEVSSGSGAIADAPTTWGIASDVALSGGPFFVAATVTDSCGTSAQTTFLTHPEAQSSAPNVVSTVVNGLPVYYHNVGNGTDMWGPIPPIVGGQQVTITLPFGITNPHVFTQLYAVTDSGTGDDGFYVENVTSTGFTVYGQTSDTHTGVWSVKGWRT